MLKSRFQALFYNPVPPGKVLQTRPRPQPARDLSGQSLIKEYECLNGIFIQKSYKFAPAT